ncbi:MAG: hypothetical protein E6G94_01405 [Alphaproteobacteria bacterium]|nr:MAG: hypothetical protein E6G94_01405 [Alphaproteobacteria bacterium]
MIILGILFIVGAALAAGHDSALAFAALIAAFFYFSLSGAFVLLGKNAHYAELTAWHLQELRAELRASLVRQQPDVVPVKPPPPVRAAIPSRDEPYRL